MGDDVQLPASGSTPSGFTAIGVFLYAAAAIATFAATTLLWPGTPLDRAWRLNPTAYRQIAPLKSAFGIMFLLLAAALISAGIGWFRRRLWGWRVTLLIFATQLLGDAVNCIRGDWLRGVTGVVIAGALLLFLLRRRIRVAFA